MGLWFALGDDDPSRHFAPVPYQGLEVDGANLSHSVLERAWWVNVYDVTVCLRASLSL